MIVVPWLWLFLASAAGFSDEQRCPSTPQCECKWSGGKEVADCSNRGLSRVPFTLGNNIQSLVLDGNPLGRLEKNAFKSVGLLNLQKLSLRGCELAAVEDGAFRDLKVLGDVDLSGNNLTKVSAGMFDGNENLRSIRMSGNPIEALGPYQFPRLNNLKRIDLSGCRISRVDKSAFKGLGSSVRSIALDGNRLRTASPEAFVSLAGLSSLDLHGNPWACDCQLKSFRDWLVDGKLYARPTSCAEPARLAGKMWDDVRPLDFACKPAVATPAEVVFGSPGANATLSCRISGSPRPSARWVVKGRIINNHTRAPFSNQMWIITEGPAAGPNGLSRWYNLTITQPTFENVGDYLCVADNSAGVMEETVTFTFEDPASFVSSGGTEDLTTVVVAATTASALFVLLALIVIGYCCLLRRKRRRDKKPESSGRQQQDKAFAACGGMERMESATPLLPFGGVPASGSRLEYQGLLSPGDESDSMMMHHHHHHHLMTTPRPQTSSSADGGSYHSNSTANAAVVEKPQPQPDLVLTDTKKTSTPLSASTLMMMRQGELPSPVPSTVSSVVGCGGVSPFQRSGTLPVHFCQSHPSSSSSRSFVLGLPPPPPPPHFQQHQHHHFVNTLPRHPAAASARPGYVTLPRRPKASSTGCPSPALLYMTLNHSNRASPVQRDPIYDGVGPRTSADGSSKQNLASRTMPRNLKKNSAPAAAVLVDPVMPSRRTTSFSSTSGLLLPPLIDEDEASSSPEKKKQLPNSTPNILDLSDGGGGGGEKKKVNGNGGVDVLEEDGNVSGYLEPFGKAQPPKGPEKKLSASLPRKPSVDSSSKTVGFRPIPAPKPRQRLAPGQSRKRFQDEGADGSEV